MTDPEAGPEQARYPGYDVLSKRDTPSWNDVTRRVIAERMAVKDEPQFLDATAWATLKALCARILPQQATAASARPPAPLAAFVDRKLLEDRRDGYRDARLPPLREAWTRGLAALEAEALAAHRLVFYALSAAAQDALIGRMQRGDLQDPSWGDMPCELFFSERAAPDIVRAYYAHPNAWSEIGFGGPASPRGYVRIDFGKRDPWEAPVARENARADR